MVLILHNNYGRCSAWTGIVITASLTIFLILIIIVQFVVIPCNALITLAIDTSMSAPRVEPFARRSADFVESGGSPSQAQTSSEGGSAAMGLMPSGRNQLESVNNGDNMISNGKMISNSNSNMISNGNTISNGNMNSNGNLKRNSNMDSSNINSNVKEVDLGFYSSLYRGGRSRWQFSNNFYGRLYLAGAALEGLPPGEWGIESFMRIPGTGAPLGRIDQLFIAQVTLLFAFLVMFVLAGTCRQRIHTRQQCCGAVGVRIQKRATPCGTWCCAVFRRWIDWVLGIILLMLLIIAIVTQQTVVAIMKSLRPVEGYTITSQPCAPWSGLIGSAVVTVVLYLSLIIFNPDPFGVGCCCRPPANDVAEPQMEATDPEAPLVPNSVPIAGAQPPRNVFYVQ